MSKLLSSSLWCKWADTFAPQPSPTMELQSWVYMLGFIYGFVFQNSPALLMMKLLFIYLFLKEKETFLGICYLQLLDIGWGSYPTTLTINSISKHCQKAFKVSPCDSGNIKVWIQHPLSLMTVIISLCVGDYHT